jgi:alkylated DNA repair dioxygenase AlkB
MNAPVTYTPAFLPPVLADVAFTKLFHELEWLRHPKVPRSEYFVSRIGKPYAYGKAEYARTYEPQPSHEALDGIWALTEQMASCKFDVCFLNKYHDAQDQLGWHADDSPEMDDWRPIGVVTLMEKAKEARELWFQAKGAPETLEKLPLGHGSLALMAAGMQDTHVHRIPKASFKCGARISLTFRGYAEP